MTTELADNVRKYRRRAGMSQEELAHAAGVSPGAVRKAEQGGPSAWMPCTRLPVR
ncbi:helix-turn-helix transcriptional regulator [Streptomyces sp. NPDC051815]|uniref:helix-turn-helix transcriptional regulator n=1 Tax=Streptomyces sp. NPDC051815 TaxID=3365674 RepID=UPI003788D54F